MLSRSGLSGLGGGVSTTLSGRFNSTRSGVTGTGGRLRSGVNGTGSNRNAVSSSVRRVGSRRRTISGRLTSTRGGTRDNGARLLSTGVRLLSQGTDLASAGALLRATCRNLLRLGAACSRLASRRSRLARGLRRLSGFGRRCRRVIQGVGSTLPSDRRCGTLRRRVSRLGGILRPCKVGTPSVTGAVRAIRGSVGGDTRTVRGIRVSLGGLKASKSTVGSTLDRVSRGVSRVGSNVTRLSGTVSKLSSGSISISSTLTLVSRRRSDTSFGVSSTVSALASGRDRLGDTLARLSDTRGRVRASRGRLTSGGGRTGVGTSIDGAIALSAVSSVLATRGFSVPTKCIASSSGGGFVIHINSGIGSRGRVGSLILFSAKVSKVKIVRLRSITSIFITSGSSRAFTEVGNGPNVMLDFSGSDGATSSAIYRGVGTGLSSLSGRISKLRFAGLCGRNSCVGLMVGDILRGLLVNTILTVVVLFLFLESVGPALVITYSVPVDIIFTVILVCFDNMALGVVSLSKLTVKINVLISGSIIIVRGVCQLEDVNVSPVGTTLGNTERITNTVATSALAAMYIFLPVMFIRNVAHRLFISLTLAIACSLLTDLVITLALIPTVKREVLHGVGPGSTPGSKGVGGTCRHSLHFMLGRGIPTVLITITLLFADTNLYLVENFDFVPSVDDARVRMSLGLSSGTAFRRAIGRNRGLGSLLSGCSRFRAMNIVTNGSSDLVKLANNSSSGSTNSLVTCTILGSSFAGRDNRVSGGVRGSLRDLSNRTTMDNNASDSVSDLVNSNSIRVALCNSSLSALGDATRSVNGALRGIGNITSISGNVNTISPRVGIAISGSGTTRGKLAITRICRRITTTVSARGGTTALAGSSNGSVGIIIMGSSDRAIAPGGLHSLSVACASGDNGRGAIGLSSISSVSGSRAVSGVDHRGRGHCLAVDTRIGSNCALASISGGMGSTVGSCGLPGDYSVSCTNASRVAVRTISRLVLVLLLNVVLVCLVVITRFRDLGSPFVVVFAVPLTFANNFLTLLVAKFSVDIMSLINFMVLYNVVMGGNVMLISCVGGLHASNGREVRSVIRTNGAHVHPVLVATLAAILNLIIVTLNVNANTRVVRPVTVIYVKNLLCTAFVALCVIPIVCSLFGGGRLGGMDSRSLRFVSRWGVLVGGAPSLAGRFDQRYCCFFAFGSTVTTWYGASGSNNTVFGDGFLYSFSRGSVFSFRDSTPAPQRTFVLPFRSSLMGYALDKCSL